MRKLYDRHEIARAINYKQMPTVVIDLSITDDYGICGTKVCIDNGKFKTGEPFYIEATLRAFNDEKTLKFCQYASGLHADFTYYDMENMLSYANAPIIKPDQDILVCLIDSKRRYAYNPVVLHTGKRTNPHCQTPLDLEKLQVIWEVKEGE